MKTWQMFVVGVAAVVALLFLPRYERAIAGTGTVAIIAAVILGFVAHPRREVFIVRTSSWVLSPDEVSLEHNCLAVRLEIARLWVLFIPTSLAVAFLVVAAARGTVWDFTLLGRFWEMGPFLFGRVLVLVVWGIVSTWVIERWTLRYADSACSARSVSANEGRVSYSFVDCCSEYYGGEDLAFGLVDSAELATIVLYNERKPQMNKIAVACLFHRLTVIGRGLADLDEETVTRYVIPILAQHRSG